MQADVAKDGARPIGAYAWYVLFILFLANAFNAIDRAMVSILVESIRAEFHFNDLELGILSGLGFALFYALLGIPIARWADTGNRKNILALGIAIWSAMTVLTGRAIGFVTFLLARAGVGIGEASCYPTAYPLITDYFSRARRPIAMAIFQMGLFVGIVAGNIIAAKIAAAYGWRTAFLAMGLPGLVLALIVFLTIREPKRGMSDPDQAPPARGSFGAMIGLIARDGAFRAIVLGTTFLTLASATLGSWGPAFMMRVHNVAQADVGFVAAPIGMAAILGTVAGGLIGTLLAKRSQAERAPLAVPIWVVLLALPTSLLFIFAGQMPLALAGGALSAFAIAAHTGPVIAVAVGNVRPEARGLASAIIVIGHLLVGFGLGPVIVGQVSDWLRAGFGAGGLRYALLVAPVCVVLGWLFLLQAWKRLRQP